MANENVSMTQRQAPSLDQPQTPEVMTVMPLVDIYENQDEILLVADFPGVPKESLSVRIDRSELLIQGTQALPQEQPHIQPLAFSRAFRVPNTVDPNRISAELKHGVLQVRLAKSEAAKPRRIEVRST